MKILISQGHILDPVTGRDGTYDILIEDQLITRIKKSLSVRKARIISAKGCLVFPGLIDLHCHLREPGREDEETIITGSQAAVAGGFTTICCMPNTEPPLDNKVAIRYVRHQAQAAFCRILPIGCISIRREGQRLAPYGEMVEEGAVAFSDDGSCVMDSLLMRRALEYTRLHHKPVISHAEDYSLAKNGVMNEGPLSIKLGLPGIPRQAEEIMVARDVALSALTGGRLHLAHLTTQEAVEVVRSAKKRRLPVTAEVTVHHLTLTEEAVTGYNTQAKVSPPLRTKLDIEALVRGLKDGTVDCIVTDHAPHSEEEKEAGFENAPFGMIGLETALPLAWRLVGKDLNPLDLISAFITGPAKVLGIPSVGLAEGQPADIAIFNPDTEWVYQAEKVVSKSKNSPFLGWKLRGKVVATIVAGKMVYSSHQ
ncbi:MAG: dihydroorotase [Candidatus Omnitrophica bacterium]|nr:dihydroorotase [Candidatus Omnitrophota bacterium]